MNQPSFITSDTCIKLEIPAIWSVLTRNFFVSREKSIFEDHTKNDTLQEIKMIKDLDVNFYLSFLYFYY